LPIASLLHASAIRRHYFAGYACHFAAADIDALFSFIISPRHAIQRVMIRVISDTLRYADALRVVVMLIITLRALFARVV